MTTIFAYGTGIAITTVLMITGSLVGGLVAQALIAHKIYRVGWEDGCTDAHSHSDTHHSDTRHNYHSHLSDYIKHYDHGLADCISQDSYNTVDMPHKTYNN